MSRTRKTDVLSIEDVNGVIGERYMKFEPAFGGRDTVYVLSPEFGAVRPEDGYCAWDVFMEAEEVDEYYQFVRLNGEWRVVEVEDVKMAMAKNVTPCSFSDVVGEMFLMYDVLSEKAWLPFESFGQEQVLFVESPYGTPQVVNPENIHLFITRQNTMRYRFTNHRGVWKVVLFNDRPKFFRPNLFTLEQAENVRFGLDKQYVQQPLAI